MHSASRTFLAGLCVHLALCILQFPSAASAQTPPVITEVLVQQEGRTIEDRLVTGLIETTVGEPLSMREMRETLTHLASLNRYEDVQVLQESFRRRYPAALLTRATASHRSHRVPRLAGSGRGSDSADRDGAVRRRSRGGVQEDVAEALRVFYSERGFPAARDTGSRRRTRRIGRRWRSRSSPAPA